MTKRIVAKVGEYQKDGETKGEYMEVGVILSNENGEYVLLDPAISLSGLLSKQNALAMKTGKQQRDMVMSSIFENDNQNQHQAPQQNTGYGAPQQQQYIDPATGQPLTPHQVQSGYGQPQR